MTTTIQVKTHVPSQLEPGQEQAVIAWCKKYKFFNRVSGKIKHGFFMSQTRYALYEYLVTMHAQRSNTNIHDAEFVDYAGQQQVDPVYQKAYRAEATACCHASSSYDDKRVLILIEQQLRFLAAKDAIKDQGKNFSDGNLNAIFDRNNKMNQAATIQSSMLPESEDVLAELKQERAIRIEGLRNKLPFIDERVQFTLKPGMTVIGGFLKAGKSTLMANLVPVIFRTAPTKKILLFSLEDGTERAIARIACCGCLVNSNYYLSSPELLTADEIDRVDKTAEWLTERIATVGVKNYKVFELESVQEILMNAKSDPDISCIIFDHYQIVRASKNPKLRDKYAVLKEFGPWLTEYASDLKIPLVMLAQLRAADEKRNEEFADLIKDDRQIAQHAAVILGVKRSVTEIGEQITEIKCHYSRWGDKENVGTFSYNGGRLIFKAGTAT
jgi:replicative DNA helicase